MSNPNAMTRRTFGATVAGLAVSMTGPAQDAPANAPPGMALVPAGAAVLGTSPEEAEAIGKRYDVHPSWFALEHPRRETVIGAFYIDVQPVTVRAFLDFVRETDYPWDYYAQFQEGAGGARLPVAHVNINDAQAYAAWAGKRLPTADEWEYAARGPEGRLYPWGNAWEEGRCAHRAAGVMTKGALPIDAAPGDASPFGVCGMAGNVCEWTTTRLGASHVVKGGFFELAAPWMFRAAARNLSQLGSNRQGYIGFRCAKDC